MKLREACIGSVSGYKPASPIWWLCVAPGAPAARYFAPDLAPWLCCVCCVNQRVATQQSRCILATFLMHADVASALASCLTVAGPLAALAMVGVILRLGDVAHSTAQHVE
jgi:hypothetical protein